LLSGLTDSNNELHSHLDPEHQQCQPILSGLQVLQRQVVLSGLEYGFSLVSSATDYMFLLFH